MKKELKFNVGDGFVCDDTNHLVAVCAMLERFEHRTPECFTSKTTWNCIVYDGEQFKECAKEEIAKVIPVQELKDFYDQALEEIWLAQMEEEKMKCEPAKNQWDVMTNADHIKESKLLDGLSEEIKHQAAILWVKVYGFEITQVCHASATNQADMALETFVNRFKS